jgi:ATP-dependent protease ClpP protease subunit
MERENMAGVIADSTGKPLAEVQRDILEATVLNSAQAPQYGFAHKIRTELFENGARMLEIT